MDLSFFSSHFLSFLLLLFILVLISWKKKSTTKISPSNNPPPGPPKLPLIGNLHQLICLVPHRRLAELSKAFGPLMQLQLGQVPTVVVSSPQLAKAFFKDYDINFSERCRVSVTDIVFYNRKDIAFAPYGEYWRLMRKISTVELFSPKRVQSFRFIREEEISDFIRSVNSKVGSPINLTQMVFSLTYSIVARTVMGWKSKNQSQAFLPLLHRLLKAMAGFSVFDVFPSFEFFHVISGMKSRLMKLHKEIDEMLEDIIKDHKAEIKSDQNEANNLLDVLLNLQANPDYSLETGSIKAIILDMFTAGIDTSATTVEWVMSELLKNPRVMKKAQQEVRKVYAEYKKFDEAVVHKLKFMKAIINETLRLHPPAPLIPRQCRERCKINGYNINVKTEVLINVWAIGRDLDYWTEPEIFYPERFLDIEVDYKGSNFEFIPFGGGRRICPGILLGVANLELLIAEILYKFDWKLPSEMKPEDLDMIEAFSITVRRKNHLHLIPIPYCVE